MAPDRFWQIIERVRPTPPDAETFGPRKAALLELPPEEILQFRVLLDDLVGKAYRIDLWGAGSVIHGGCSDDGFHYFRVWLVGMGREVYEQALAAPDSLADVLHGEWPLEGSHDVAAARAWEEKTGRTGTEFYPELAAVAGPYREVDEGEDWDLEDEEECRRRLPRLSRIYFDEADA